MHLLPKNQIISEMNRLGCSQTPFLFLILSAMIFPALQATVAMRLQPGRERRGCPFERLQFFVEPNEQPQGDRDRETDLTDHLCQFHVVSRPVQTSGVVSDVWMRASPMLTSSPVFVAKMFWVMTKTDIKAI